MFIGIGKYKKILLIGISLIVLIILGLFILSQSGENNSGLDTINLAASQEVQELPEARPELPLSPERLKQLEQLQDIQAIQTSLYTETLESIFSRGGIELDQEKIRILEEVLAGDTLMISNIQQELSQKLGVQILLSDTRRLIEAYTIQQEEEEVHNIRLEVLRENNTKDIQQTELEVITLIIEDRLNMYSNITAERQKTTTEIIIDRISQDASYMGLTTGEKYELIEENINFALDRITQLTAEEKTRLTQAILSELELLNIISQENIIPVGNGGTSWQEMIFPKVYANEDNANYEELLLLSIRYISSLPVEELTDTRKKILHLQIDILTDLTVQKSIELELSLTRGEISGTQYNTLSTSYYTLLEEILLLKESIDNPSGNLSLDEIQAYNLGQYVDDSELIQNMTPLAYIASKTGYVFIKNLNGSYKLGKENILLYPGYEIETGNTSEGVLIFADESILRLEANSRVVLSGNPENIITSVESGNIWARIIKPFVSGNSFTLEGSGISLGVRGTSVYFSEESDEVYIVDSHNDDASAEITGGRQLSAGQKISLGESENSAPEDFSRSNLLDEKPQIGLFIRDDLKELSVLLDDKKRGFHNNPLSSLNGDSEYFGRLEAEITNSLPRGSEKAGVFQSPQIAAIQDSIITAENIYSLAIQDTLISELDKSTSGNKETKRNAILSTNFQNLEQELGSKRAIQRRYELGLSRDIINTPTLNSAQLEDIVRDFPLPQRELDREILEKAAQELRKILNDGSNVMLSNFTLPNQIILSEDELGGGLNISFANILSAEISRENLSVVLPLLSLSSSGEQQEPEQVSITWESSDQEIIAITDNLTANRIRGNEQNLTAILTPTLRYKEQIISRDYSFEVPANTMNLDDKFEIAHKLLQKKINTIHTFTRNIPILEGDLGDIRNEIGDDSLTLSWEVSGRIASQQGDIIQPTYNQGDEENVEVIANIQIGGENRKNDLTLPRVLKEGCHNGKIIGNECYNLVASADYNSDLFLRNPSGTIILDNEGQTNIGSGLGFINQGDLNSTLNDLTYAPNIPKQVVNHELALVNIDGRSGVLIGNKQDSYLSYNLQDLDLGDDWAIEMSVRGEDLRRTDQYTLINIPSVNYRLNFIDDNGNKVYSLGNGANLIESINTYTGYQEIILNEEGLFIQNDQRDLSNIPETISEINIGSRIDGSGTHTTQWNGIINYMRIYKNIDEEDEED